jgi:hypothetical protein
MMRALIAGQSDSAALAKGRMRTKIPDLRKALTGRFREHHGFLLKRMLDQVEAQEAEIAALDQVELLTTVPGVDHRSARVILAEIGPDMAVFPTAAHLASWAGMCPGQRDSAGKHGSGKTRKGPDPSGYSEPWSSPPARPHAPRAPTCPNATGRSCAAAVMPKAIVALGHEILLSAYRVLGTAQAYTDPGPTTLSRLTAQRLTRQAVRRLQDLGYRVTIAPRTDAA